jgi:uncharacterized metal-binding protein YceD (DUF177 family)
MKVHINQIPADGLHLEGEDPAAILELDDPYVQPRGGVRWSLDIGLSDGGLFATGKLAVDLNVECVACLRKFTYLTDQMREDILLALPPYPHCDWNGQNVCKGAARESTESPGESHTWDELDKLKFKSK